MRKDPVVFIVADVRTHGGVQVEGHVPAQVTVQVGQELHVNARYAVREHGGGREAFVMRFESEIGTQRPRPVERRWKDLPMRSDDESGMLGHRFVFDRPGTYDGKVLVTAAYGEGRWFGRMVTKQEAEASGTIRVQVV